MSYTRLPSDELDLPSRTFSPQAKGIMDESHETTSLRTRLAANPSYSGMCCDTVGCIEGIGLVLLPSSAN